MCGVFIFVSNKIKFEILRETALIFHYKGEEGSTNTNFCVTSFMDNPLRTVYKLCIAKI